MENQTCNIGPRGVRKRLLLSIPLLGAGIAASFLTRSFLGQVVAFFGFLSLFQALDQTCVFLAARGATNDDQGQRMLGSIEEIEFFRQRSRRIYLKTFVATLALMLMGRAWIYWYG